MLPVATGSHGSGTYLIQLYDHGCRQCLVARVGAQTIESAAHSTDSLDSHHSLTYSSAVPLLPVRTVRDEAPVPPSGLIGRTADWPPPLKPKSS